MPAQATVALEKAKKREPDKASIREALGIAYFRIQRWDEAEAEFRALLELSPTRTTTRTTRSAACSRSRGACTRRTGTTSSRTRSAPARPRTTSRASATSARGTLRAGGRPARLARARDARRRDRPGLCVLLGVAAEDEPAAADRLAAKVARLRVFENDAGKFDRSLLDVGGEALVVSQFTLIADTAKGNRPSVLRCSRPGGSSALRALLRELARSASRVEFGRRMALELVDDGPVTIVLET